MATRNKRRLENAGKLDTDNTYVAKPEIHQSYRFQPTVRDLGGVPGRNMSQEDRNKRQKYENDVNAVRNVVRGLDNTFGTAISLASVLYGGGWAGTRLAMGRATPVGQALAKYVLPANSIDTAADAVGFIGNPSLSGAADLGSGLILGRYKDFGKKVRQAGELVGQGFNINNIIQ